MGKMLPGSQGGSCWGPGQARKPPGGARSGAPWAPNDQDDIGDNTQHILPPGAHPPYLAYLTRSHCHLQLTIPASQENMRRVLRNWITD